MADIETITGDCLDVLDTLPKDHFDLVYLDPPFFTQKQHSLTTRDGSARFSFSDLWASNQEYACFLHARLMKLRQALKHTGSLFFHCDRSAAHIVRFVLDDVFDADRFQSEIIWSYRRWSNARKGLLPSHQTLLFYSKSEQFKFNPIYGDYSETTNLDQITQTRKRDARNKVVYARDEEGEVVLNGPKKGVPLGDVWDIPYLNPKAAERTGYPTQKPVLLLERILNLCTNENDWVLDPFCGSGTTLVASRLMGRNAIGIDISPEAIALTKQRLQTLIKTESALLEKGRAEYTHKDKEALDLLQGLEFFPVQRNKGIDAILKQQVNGNTVFVRVQRRGESLSSAATLLRQAAVGKGQPLLILVVIEENNLSFDLEIPHGVHIVPHAAMGIRSLLTRLQTPSPQIQL